MILANEIAKNIPKNHKIWTKWSTFGWMCINLDEVFYNHPHVANAPLLKT